jgi:hypothetical protein
MIYNHFNYLNSVIINYVLIKLRSYFDNLFQNNTEFDKKYYLLLQLEK